MMKGYIGKFFFLFNILTFFYGVDTQAQAPANDLCTNAILLTAQPNCAYYQYTNLNATATSNDPNPSCGGTFAGGDVWFKIVVPASGNLNITTNVVQILDGVMALYSGNCNALTEIACDDDGGPNGLMPFISVTGLTPGSTVYLRFWEYGNDNNGTFNICVQTTAICNNGNASGCGCPDESATDCYLLPDILAGKRTLNATRGWTEYNQLINGVNKGLIRLDVSTPNVGFGPMEIMPTNDYICGTDTLRNFFPSGSFLCPDGSFPKRLINQRIYHKVNDHFEYLLRPAGYMQYHPAHGHIHIDGWGLYTLRLKDNSIADTLKWPIVNSGIKVSFCLIDLTTCTGALGDCVDTLGNVLNNTNVRNYGLGGGYNCGNLIQGISVGKVDIYGQYLDESFVKIPYETCNGEYYAMIQIDPDNHFLEMNENNNWLSAKTVLTKQRPTNTNPYAYIFSEKGNVICNGDSLKLHASGASRYTWSTGQTTQDIIIRQPGKYWVEAVTPCGSATSDTLDIFSAGASSYPESIMADTVCSGYTANLYASGNAHWYNAPIGGDLLHIGNTFQTGTLNASQTFYVADQPPYNADSVGAYRNQITSNGDYTQNAEDYLIFNAFLPFKINKVSVYANGAGVRYIQLRNIYGKTIVEKPVILRDGFQEVELNFYVPAGLNHQLGLSKTQGITKLYTNKTTNNVGFPFKINALMNIIGSSKGDSVYPYFYNWQVENIPQTCNNGARLSITAVVAPNVTPSISGIDPLYLHTNNPALAILNPPGGVLTGNGVLGNTFNPQLAGIGVHQLQYNYHYGRCSTQTQFTTEVKFDSSIIQYNTEIGIRNNVGIAPVLFIKANQKMPLEIRFYNSVGQFLKVNKLEALRGNNLFELNLNNVAKGFYLVEVFYGDEKSRKVFKLIK